MLHDYQGEVSKLGKAEQFYLEMLKLPRYSQKLDALYVRSDFDSRIAEVAGSIQVLHQAVGELSDGDYLRGVFEAILQVPFCCLLSIFLRCTHPFSIF